MQKKLKITNIGIVALFFILLSNTSWGFVPAPPKENVTAVLDYMLVAYLSNETQTRFTKGEVKDFVDFYQKTEDFATADFSVKGKHSGKAISKIYGIVIQPQPKPCTGACQACVQAAKAARDKGIEECKKKEQECHDTCDEGDWFCHGGCSTWGFTCKESVKGLYRATVDGVCCNDGDPCTISKYNKGSNMCTYTLKTCKPNKFDKCCPPGCSIQEDKDCAEQKCSTFSTDCTGCIQEGCEWCITDQQGGGKCVYPCKKKQCAGAPKACRDNVGECPSGSAPKNYCGKKEKGRCKYFCKKDERKINDQGDCDSGLVCCTKKKCKDRCEDLGYSEANCRDWGCKSDEEKKGGCGLFPWSDCCCVGPQVTTTSTTTTTSIPFDCPSWTCEDILADPTLRAAVEKYDANNDGKISDSEKEKAMLDYLNAPHGDITKDEACAVVLFNTLDCELPKCTQGGACSKPGEYCCENGKEYKCVPGPSQTTTTTTIQCQPSDCPQPKPGSCPFETDGVCHYGGEPRCAEGSSFPKLVKDCGWICDHRDDNKQCDSSQCTNSGWDNSPCGTPTDCSDSGGKCVSGKETGCQSYCKEQGKTFKTCHYDKDECQGECCCMCEESTPQEGKPFAAFSYWRKGGEDIFPGDEIQFFDLSPKVSTEAIESWSWDFGDGSTSSKQNPTHSYGDQGVYEVTLTVTGVSGKTSSITNNVDVFSYDYSQQPVALIRFCKDENCNEIVDTVVEGTKVWVDASLSEDPDKEDIVKYCWDVSWYYPTSCGPNKPTVWHKFKNPGYYEQEVNVKDGADVGSNDRERTLHVVSKS